MNLFYDAVLLTLTRRRDLAKLCSALAVSWPAVAREVNVGDYVAVETVRLFDLLYTIEFELKRSSIWTS
jgi:hypothetical protein